MNVLFRNVLIASILLTQVAVGQEDFSELPAKERIAIAKSEEVEAKQDVVFQKKMQEGHELFKGKHYLKAIHKYEEAQEQRPYNVYPKVIIADIELSMKDTLEILRAEEKIQKETPKPKVQAPDKPETKPDSTTTEDRMRKLDEWEAAERKKRESQRKAEEKKEPAPKSVTGDVEQMSLEDYQKELAKAFPEGVSETIEEEGNRTTTTRVVVKDGTGNEYKKVVHNWGGVFYFKNGEAVTERTWKSETE